MSPAKSDKEACHASYMDKSAGDGHHCACPCCQGFVSKRETGAKEELLSAALPGHVVVLVDNAAAARGVFLTDVADGQHVAIRFCTAVRAWLAGNPSRRLTLSWCPSHSGVPENEAADALVGSYQGPDALPFLSRVAAFRRFRHSAGLHWRVAWMSHAYRGHHLLRFRDSRRPLPPSLGAGRFRFLKACNDSPALFSRFVRTATDHMPSAGFRARFFPGSPSACLHCGPATPLTRAHILCRCPKYKGLFPSLYAFFHLRSNFVALATFLRDNPTAASFGDIDPVAPPAHLLLRAGFVRLFPD